jgi:cytochrome c553
VKTLLHLVAALFVLALDWVTGASRSADPPPPRAAIARFVAKHPWFTAAALAAFAGMVAAVVVVSGVVPVRASSGHWPITTWLLDFTKVRSVHTYSLGIEAPPLDDPALVVRGARHYDLACAPCHGSPGTGVPPVMQAMTPAPPELRGRNLTRWTPEQLFSIVKHGIKFTGMPAWPVQQRDDEIWAVVAFLRRLPQMDRAEYQRLVRGGPAPPLPLAGALEPPRPVRDVCWRCHDPDGTGPDGGAFPSLAGQRAAYLDAALRAFASRSRYSGTMVEIAARLSDAEIREVSAYYERLPRRIAVPAPATTAGDAAIATAGDPQREIPACMECHGPTAMPKSPAYPILAGQHARYLALQLELLKQRRRGGSPRVNIMHAVVDRLTPGEIQALARYYASVSETLQR